MGRPKQFTERLVLSMVQGTTERIDAALADGEYRLDLIRTAIENELARRQDASAKPARKSDR